MSLYNNLFGMNEDYEILLGMIGLNMEYFQRFRDIDLTHDGNIIRVFTRLGGGNRQHYRDTWNKIRRHELYLGDYDDGYDETYTYIEFSVPDNFKETTRKMFKEEPIPFKQKFEQELQEMNIPGTPAYERSFNIAKKLAEQIINDEGEGNITFLEI